MATFTHNHLYLVTRIKATSGTWSGETSQWGLRFAVNGGGNVPFQDRPDLNAGIINLNTFDCHTSIKSRTVTVSSTGGTLLQQWIGDDVPESEQVTENDNDFFLTKAMDLFKSLQSVLPNTYQLEHIKLYAVNEEGKSPLGPNTWTPGSTQLGSATSILSPEVAMAVSLYTAHRHKQGRGRIFIGPLSQSYIGTNGLWAAGNPANVAGYMKTLQDSVRTRGTPGASATYAGIVWSRKEKGKGSVINKIRVGDEPDHQERRTKARPETYVEAAVA